MPPPNVTARAHLGHGSTFTPMDVLTRYHRMLGENADWLPGVDHAAIATEAVLVKELAREGVRRDDLGRQAFVERAWQWSRSFGGQIEAQFRRLGFGADWQRSRFTMDEGLSAAVQRVFVELYREGLIYRGKRLINWDPTGKTTVSDAEVDWVERDAMLWRIRYPFSKDDLGHGIDVATRRAPSNDILGDVAVAVHPKDERYAAYVGRSVWLPPLMSRTVPIIADESVDPSFGTGAVKVDAGARRRRLRDRPAARPSCTHDHRLRRAHHGQRDRRWPLRRPRSFRGSRPHRGRSRRSGPAPASAGVPAFRGDERPHGRRDRAVAFVAVVREDAWAGATGVGRVPRRALAIRPGALRTHVRTLAREHPRLECLASDLVGTPATGLVHARWPRDCGRERRPRRLRSLSASTANAIWSAIRDTLDTWFCERHLAVFNPRLAREDAQS